MVGIAGVDFYPNSESVTHMELQYLGDHLVA